MTAKGRQVKLGGVGNTATDFQALWSLRACMRDDETHQRKQARSPETYPPNPQVRKADFALALGRLGLVLTHGQAATLANKHHGDYERFLAKLGDPKRRPPPEVRGGTGHLASKIARARPGVVCGVCCCFVFDGILPASNGRGKGIP